MCHKNVKDSCYQNTCSFYVWRLKPNLNCCYITQNSNMLNQGICDPSAFLSKHHWSRKHKKNSLSVLMSLIYDQVSNHQSHQTHHGNLMCSSVRSRREWKLIQIKSKTLLVMCIVYCIQLFIFNASSVNQDWTLVFLLQ